MDEEKIIHSVSLIRQYNINTEYLYIGKETIMRNSEVTMMSEHLVYDSIYSASLPIQSSVKNKFKE